MIKVKYVSLPRAGFLEGGSMVMTEIEKRYAMVEEIKEVQDFLIEFLIDRGKEERHNTIKGFFTDNDIYRGGNYRGKKIFGPFKVVSVRGKGVWGSEEKETPFEVDIWALAGKKDLRNSPEERNIEIKMVLGGAVEERFTLTANLEESLPSVEKCSGLRELVQLIEAGKMEIGRDHAIGTSG